MDILSVNSFKGNVFHFPSSNLASKGDLILVHGICEHAMRYRGLIETLSAEGYNVVVMDHQAHGSSVLSDQKNSSIAEAYRHSPAQTLRYLGKEVEGSEGDSLYQEAWKGLSVYDLLEDQLRLLHSLYEEKIFCKERPLTVFGHSMGGLIATALVDRLYHQRHCLPANLILSSPAFRPGFNPDDESSSFLRRVHHFSVFLKRRSYLKPVAKFMGALASLKGRENTAWAEKHISDLEMEREIYRLDPMISASSRVSFLLSIESLMVEMESFAQDFTLPLAIFYGEGDPIVDSEGTDEFLARFSENAQSSEPSVLKLKAFPYHELLRSSRAEECEAFLLKSLQRNSAHAEIGAPMSVVGIKKDDS